MDEYDPNLPFNDKEGNVLREFRIAMVTAQEEFYLLVFDMQKMKENKYGQLGLGFQGIIQGSRWITSISDMRFVVGTDSGYSLVELLNESTGIETSPYVRVKGRQEQWGPVQNLEIVDRNEYDPKDLIATSSNFNGSSSISVYRKGISLETYLRHKVPRISYSNSVSINGVAYLLLTINHRFRILRVDSLKKEEDIEPRFLAPEKPEDINFSLNEIVKERSNLKYSCLLYKKGENIVSSF